MATPEERLQELGLAVPEVAKPVAAYVPAVQSGNYVYTAGQLPMRAGSLIATGKVGAEISPELAAECAQQCALNGIAAVRSIVGELSRVVRVVKVVAFVASTPDFTGQPGVANGASELIGSVFGDAGLHARSAVGVPVLPLDAPVEVELLVEVSLTLSERRRVPPSLVDDAAAYLASGRAPVEPKGASTVVLLRDGETAGVDVYLLRRHVGMAFAAGMYAFPGGTVDPRDFDADIGWVGPTASEWAERMSCREPEARALVCAAVRETFEESGVLLAGDSPEAVVSDTRGDDWEADRAALVDRSLSFAAFVERRGLALRTDLLAYWAHWITPEFEPRRYDTRFFVARIPDGQLTRDVSGEADRAHWTRADDAVRGAADGSMQMLPPTSVTLSEMASHASVDDVLIAARSRVVTTVVPGVEIVDGEPVFTDVDPVES